MNEDARRWEAHIKCMLGNVVEVMYQMWYARFPPGALHTCDAYTSCLYYRCNSRLWPDILSLVTRLWINLFFIKSILVCQALRYNWNGKYLVTLFQDCVVVSRYVFRSRYFIFRRISVILSLNQIVQLQDCHKKPQRTDKTHSHKQNEAQLLTYHNTHIEFFGNSLTTSYNYTS